MYATRVGDAGNPILAPDKTHNITVQKGNSTAPAGSDPLHIFGTPGAAQNLTYADGENGWSYNDKAGGIYLFFDRDANAFMAEDINVGTTMTAGYIALIAGLGAIGGLIIGVVLMMLVGRRKKKALSR